MEILTEKIKEAERFRDRYYEDHPSSTVAEKSKAVKEKVIPLLQANFYLLYFLSKVSLQDIPLETHGSSSLSAEHSLLCGRILNICIEYDPRCEKHLIQAIKLNPHLADAWHELGECLWKKKDCEAAVDCFKKSLSHERTAKSMCALSSALRQLAVSTGDKKKQEELREEATRLCAEAVRIESGSGVAWHAFGNSLLTDFFAKGQSDEQILWLPSLAVPGRRSAVQSGFCWLSGTALEHILRCCSPRRSRDGTGPRRRPTSAEKNAREAYEKALTIDEGRLNADLHLNYATALEFEQDYARCLRHMHIASSSDPELFGAKEKYETLCSFLMRLSEAVRRKGKLKAKRLLEFQRSLSKTECSQYQSFSVRSKNSEKRASREADFDSLHEGLNENIIIAGKVVGIVPNPDSIPFAFVGCDKNGSCLAFTVYNFSPKFGMVIGDSFAVADPFIVDVEASAVLFGVVDEVCCDHLPVDGQIRFRAVRIPSPHVLLKNGKGVSVDSVAFCEVGSTCTL
ncbi:unnamed protein product [Toxocara canis]|uniref:TTC5_OB domain-containing protein n=1 Tax=Toxocara canis TaxID=6265 RepID=A0A183UJB7_TOXCA|nr:unnamed protein product [Toxocara canis]